MQGTNDERWPHLPVRGVQGDRHVLRRVGYFAVPARRAAASDALGAPQTKNPGMKAGVRCSRWRTSGQQPLFPMFALTSLEQIAPGS